MNCQPSALSKIVASVVVPVHTRDDDPDFDTAAGRDPNPSRIDA